MANQSKNSKLKQILAKKKSESPVALPASKYSKPHNLQEKPFITEQIAIDEEKAKAEAAARIIGQELERVESDYKRLQSDQRRISEELQQIEVNRTELKCILRYLLDEDTNSAFRRNVVNWINNPEQVKWLTRTIIAGLIQQRNQ